jgi:hypothetical protein
MSYKFEYIFRTTIENKLMLFAHLLKGKYDAFEPEQIKKAIKLERYEPYEDGDFCMSLEIKDFQIEISVENFYSACNGVEVPLYNLVIKHKESKLSNMLHDCPYEPRTYRLYGDGQEVEELYVGRVTDSDIGKICRYLKMSMKKD